MTTLIGNEFQNWLAARLRGYHRLVYRYNPDGTVTIMHSRGKQITLPTHDREALTTEIMRFDHSIGPKIG